MRLLPGGWQSVCPPGISSDIMTTALVTGATGFVGSAVARRLRDAGFAVRALVRDGADQANLEGLQVKVVIGDLCDRPSLDRAARGCDALFHVAADYRLWTRDPASMLRTNVEGSRNVVLSAADAGVTRMVYTSSVATLGINANGTPGHEDTPVDYSHMIGPYKKSKFLAEQAIDRLIVEQGVPVVIVNPSTPVGPRDIKPTPTGRMIVEAGSGRMPAFVDTGLNIVHVDDVAAGHLLAFEKGRVGERYVLGGENMTLKDILTEIARLVEGKPPSISLPLGLVMPIAYLAEVWARMIGGKEPFATVEGIRMARKKMYFSSAKAIRELDYRPRPAKEALADAVKWFSTNGYCP